MPIYSSLGTIADLESWLGLPAGNTDEAQLTRLLSAASQDLQDACGSDMSAGPHSYTENYRVPFQRKIALRQTPVSSLTAVTPIAGVDGIGPSAFTGITISVSAQPQDGYAYMMDDVLCLPEQAFKNMIVSVQYQAGYATTPADFLQAVYEVAGQRYRNKQRIGEKNKSINGEVVGFTGETARWSAYVESVVRRYSSKVFT